MVLHLLFVLLVFQYIPARSGIPVYSDSTDIALFAHSDGHSSIPRFSCRITKKTCIDIFMYTIVYSNKYKKYKKVKTKFITSLCSAIFITIIGTFYTIGKCSVYSIFCKQSFYNRHQPKNSLTRRFLSVLSLLLFLLASWNGASSTFSSFISDKSSSNARTHASRSCWIISAPCSVEISAC